MTGLFSHARKAGFGSRRWRRARRGRGHGPAPSAQPAGPRSPRRPLNAAPGSASSRRRAAAARAEGEVGTGRVPPCFPAGAGRSHAFIFNRGAARLPQPTELPGVAGEAASPCGGTGGRYRTAASREQTLPAGARAAGVCGLRPPFRRGAPPRPPPLPAEVSGAGMRPRRPGAPR